MARKRMPWFRFYVEAPTDRKIRRLKKPEFKWVWVCVMCLARQSPVPGWLVLSDQEAVTADDIADMADVAVAKVRQALGEMERLGLVEMDESAGAWMVPAWASRQFASDVSTDRVRAHRERSKSPDETLQRSSIGRSRNAPETETETEHLQTRTSLTPLASETPPTPPTQPVGTP